MSTKLSSSALVCSTWLGPIFNRGDVNSSCYSLTFDDGPLEGSTEKILDILGTYNVKATFFVIGQNAEKLPNLIKQIAGEGHLVGNHTWTHSRLGILGHTGYWLNEIHRTNELISSIIGKQPCLFRPPMGFRTPSNSRAIRQAGHHNILWSLKARDGVSTTADAILNRVIPNIGNGDILLMHDGRDSASRRSTQPTIDALPRIITAYQDRGIIPVTLDHLLQIDAYASTTGA